MSDLNLRQRFPSPVTIASVDALRFDDAYFVRTTSAEGVVGIATVNNRLAYLWPILETFVIPFFVGKDARDLPTLVDEVFTYRSAYKLAGIPLWTCVGYVEISLFDMLGKIAGCSVGELLGPVLRREIPVYLSSLRRDTLPEEEVAWLAERLAATGAEAVKLKVGGRMSHNADAFPGRTDRLVPLARRTFGDAVTIYVDANGSYDAEHAIAVGRMLEAHDVGFFEEPCPFLHYEATRRVADALTMPVAGGEQDTSRYRFAWMVRERAVDVVQPDLMYNGGFLRCLRVASMAAEAGLPVTPHSPKVGPESASMLHFASVVPNLGPYQEYRGAYQAPASWHTPSFEIAEGQVSVPDGPGLGVRYDPAIWRKAQVLV